ncbi:MAG: thermonuclease family protein [Syntrophobacterales bacterium]|nr:MAG: thermonuclease family protein [Syntrophobacterales bacterium]
MSFSFLIKKRKGRRDIETINKLGRRASASTRKMADKKQIRLEFNHSNAYIRYKDRYGRFLAYVYLLEWTFVNAEIIR